MFLKSEESKKLKQFGFIKANDIVMHYIVYSDDEQVFSFRAPLEITNKKPKYAFQQLKPGDGVLTLHGTSMYRPAIILIASRFSTPSPAFNC